MCDSCSEWRAKTLAQMAAPTIDALEALANGEDVPANDGVGAVPLVIAQIGDDTIALITSAQGYEVIAHMMRTHGLVIPTQEGQG